VTVNAELGRTYYFRVALSLISRTTEADGLELVKQTQDARESEGDPIITYSDCKKLISLPNPTAAQRARCRP